MTAPDFEALAQPALRTLSAYDPGHDLVALRAQAAARHAALVELGSNENAFGASPRVAEAIGAALADVHRYPDPLGGRLKQALAAKLGVTREALLLGNGSHELLMLLAQVFAGPDAGVAMSRHGFAVYALAARAVGAPLRIVEPLPRGGPMPLGHDTDALAAAAGEGVRLVYLANPNNPTGTWFTMDALERLLARVPRDTLVVVDEAYAEYADAPGLASALPLLRTHANLVVTRTFSKIHGLAGLRVGDAVAHPGLVAMVERLRESFNVNALALVAAEAALADEDHVRRVRALTLEQRGWLAAELRAQGHAVFPSQTNFLLVEFACAAAEVEALLLAQGVVPRPMAGYGLPRCLRITVGTHEENRRLVAALERLA